MSVLTEVRKFFSTQQADAKALVRAIAQRDAAGQAKPDDPHKLPGLLSQAGMTEDAYARVVELFQKHRDLVTRAGGANKAAAKLAALRKEELQIKADLAKAQEAAETRQRTISASIYRAIDELRAAELTDAALDALEREHADELNIEPTDLSEFNITDGSNGLDDRLNDPTAPRRIVRPEVFRREAARRAEIVHAAQDAADLEYKAAVKRWETQSPHSGHGMIDPREYPPPERTVIRWGSLNGQRKGGK